MDAGAEDQASVCASCGWPHDRRSTKAESRSGSGSKSSEDPDRKRPGPKRRKRQGRTTSRQPERRFLLSGYAISTGFLLALWAVLAWLSRHTASAASWLVICGVLTTIIGVGWVYHSAIQDGVESINFFSSSSPFVTVRLVLWLAELMVVPIFSVVYLVLYFDSAWKSFLIEMLGLAMLATGLVLLLR
jgi:hypothetical protein